MAVYFFQKVVLSQFGGKGVPYYYVEEDGTVWVSLHIWRGEINPIIKLNKPKKAVQSSEKISIFINPYCVLFIL